MPGYVFNYHRVKNVRIRSYSGLYFPAFGVKTERCSVYLRIQCKCGNKKGAPKILQNSQGNICAGSSFAIKLQSGGLQLQEIETSVQMLSCEFFEIF